MPFCIVGDVLGPVVRCSCSGAPRLSISVKGGVPTVGVARWGVPLGAIQPGGADECTGGAAFENCDPDIPDRLKVRHVASKRVRARRTASSALAR